MFSHLLHNILHVSHHPPGIREADLKDPSQPISACLSSCMSCYFLIKLYGSSLTRHAFLYKHLSVLLSPPTSGLLPTFSSLQWSCISPASSNFFRATDDQSPPHLKVQLKPMTLLLFIPGLCVIHLPTSML